MAVCRYCMAAESINISCSIMSKISPFLCFLTDDAAHLALCLRYWAVRKDAWAERCDAIAQESGYSSSKLLGLVRAGCRACLCHCRCVHCGMPFEVRTRGHYSIYKGRPTEYASRQSVIVCKACVGAVRESEARAMEAASERHRDRLAAVILRATSDTFTFDYSSISYVQTFFLHSAMVAANVHCEGNRLGPLKYSIEDLGSTPDLSEYVYKRLYEDKIICPDFAAHPGAFTISDTNGEIDFAFDSVHWLIAEDAGGRDIGDIDRMLVARLDDAEPKAVEELWFLVAESECQKYFLKQCERYRFFQDDIYSLKVAEVIKEFLPNFSIGQMWNVIYYVIKDLAALAQEKSYARKHVYNMIPGQLRRFFDYRIASSKPPHPWRRPALLTESWMTSLLLDKVLGDGSTSFETISGQSVAMHVESSRRVVDLDISDL